MGRTKKKRGKQFIDMKNAVTFKLVARSTEDPLFCDPSAPQYVLVEKKSKDVIPIELDDVGGDQKKKKSTNLSKDARRAEQAKFGIYFDDDYDYLQHLIDAEEVPTLKGVEIVSKASMVADQEDKDVLEDPNQPSTSKGSKPQKNPSLMLPSSLFDSTVREKEALTKRAALPVGPQLDWDPDVVEAMEDDYNFDDPENQIDDDFVSQAMKADGGRVEMDEEEDAYLYDFAYKSAEQLPKNLANIEDEDHGSADDDDLSVCGAAGSGSDYDYEEEARDRFPTVGCNHHQMLELMKKKHIKKYFGLEGVQDEDDDAGTAHTLASHFTEYSMSSSVLPRSEQLRQLDAQFERLFIREYADEAAIGALDGDEDLEGADEPGLDEGSKELMAAAWEEYSEAKRQHQGAVYEPNEEAVKWIREQFAAKEAELRKKIEKHGAEVMDSSSEDSDESSDEYEEIEVADPGRKGDKERFDCESILSTYSTTSYHPRILRDTDRYGNILLGRKSRNHIRFDPRTGMPLGPSATEDSTTPTSANLAKLQQAEVGTTRTSMSRLSELSLRPKNETPEERRERKKELKDFRAARRAEKKANRMAFAEEKIRMQKAGLNNAVQKKVGVI